MWLWNIAARWADSEMALQAPLLPGRVIRCQNFRSLSWFAVEWVIRSILMSGERAKAWELSIPFAIVEYRGCFKVFLKFFSFFPIENSEAELQLDSDEDLEGQGGSSGSSQIGRSDRVAEVSHSTFQSSQLWKWRFQWKKGGHEKRTSMNIELTCIYTLYTLWPNWVFWDHKSSGKQQVEVFMQNSEWAAMDSDLAFDFQREPRWKTFKTLQTHPACTTEGSESDGDYDLDDRRDRSLVACKICNVACLNDWILPSRILPCVRLESGYARIARAQQKAEAAQRWTEAFAVRPVWSGSTRVWRVGQLCWNVEIFWEFLRYVWYDIDMLTFCSHFGWQNWNIRCKQGIALQQGCENCPKKSGTSAYVWN